MKIIYTSSLMHSESSAITFPVPAIFVRSSFECNGDMIIRSGDGIDFCVLRSTVWQASCLLRGAVLSLPQGLSTLSLPEDSATLCALLQALYPSPSPSITTIELARRCLAAAHKYHINPAVLQYHSSLFVDPSMSQNPLFLAVLAWNSRQWSLVQTAARHLHRRSTPSLLAEGATLGPGSGDVLSAILATRVMRQECIAEVVRRVPHDILCTSCRTSRSIVHGLEASFSNAFNTPYPSVTNILFDRNVMASRDILATCPTSGCWTSILDYSFTPSQLASLGAALEVVPTTIPLGLLEIYDPAT